MNDKLQNTGILSKEALPPLQLYISLFVSLHGKLHASGPIQWLHDTAQSSSLRMISSVLAKAVRKLIIGKLLASIVSYHNIHACATISPGDTLHRSNGGFCSTKADIGVHRRGCW